MWSSIVDYLVFEQLSLDSGSHFAQALHFFIYDTIKIWFLLITIIFFVSFLRTWFSTEKARAFLVRKNPVMGYILAALFGVITPFCSCSAIPLFLGFLQARIPIGVTFAFLISAPMNNEVAIAMLLGLFGWKIALLYIGFGLGVAILGGMAIGAMRMERYVLLSPPPLDAMPEIPNEAKGFALRVREAWQNTKDLFAKIYLYVVIGIGIGAWIHGYIPAEEIAALTEGSGIWSVPLAVLMGIPIYSNAAGVMPLIEVLTDKGMLLGTALAFMMAVTALSLPEAMILKRILHIRLIALFFGLIGFGIVVVGYLFNFILGV